MIIKYKKDYEKILMGFLSYLDDFKNIENLQQEMSLYLNSEEFPVYLYKQTESDFKAIISCQAVDNALVVRYFSLTPDFRADDDKLLVLSQLQDILPNKKLMFSPDYLKIGALFEKNYG